MPEARLQKTRESYRCGRSFVLTPWLHCDCRHCDYARRVPQLLADGWREIRERGIDNTWLMDPNIGEHASRQ